jgi:dihydrodiol dehydrogenase / D-xylose 1-dehydrogenase (NADP)
LKKVGAPSSAKGYGSYEELVADKNVDIIYVATPHSHHYQNAMLCLEAGKNVLCEKAFTVNAAQAKKLAEKAKEKNLFLMEAVWTRYFPLSIYVREVITSGKVHASNLLHWAKSLTYTDWHSPTHIRRPLYRYPTRGCL